MTERFWSGFGEVLAKGIAFSLKPCIMVVVNKRGAHLSGLRVSCSCLDPLPDLDNANVGTIADDCRRSTCFGVPPF